MSNPRKVLKLSGKMRVIDTRRALAEDVVEQVPANCACIGLNFDSCPNGYEIADIDTIIYAASALGRIEAEADFDWAVQPTTWEDVCAAIAKQISDHDDEPPVGWGRFIRNLLR